jgi:hypothetical protein
MTINQELNKLALEINSVTSDPRLKNYESRMNKAGERIDKVKLRRSNSKTLKFSGYESCCRKEMQIRRAKNRFLV